MTKLSSKYKTGETAEALLMEFFSTYMDTGIAKRLIKHLDENKFVIAPRPYSRPARRGIGNTKPPKYNGPVMLGKSHSAKLAGH